MADNDQEIEHRERLARFELARAQARIAELEWVISRAICFPSAGLPEHEIRRLHWLIEGARESHQARSLTAKATAA